MEIIVLNLISPIAKERTPEERSKLIAAEVQKILKNPPREVVKQMSMRIYDLQVKTWPRDRCGPPRFFFD